MAYLITVIDTCLCQITAVVCAVLRSIEYCRALGIKRSELWRYLRKSTSLALCYAGFARNGCAGECWRAGEAAFLCCAYDVLTDWRSFDSLLFTEFERILRRVAKDRAAVLLAITLYHKEQSHGLANDGLERGAIALRFITKLMGSEAECEAAWGNLDAVGEILQIVDDVLDFEDDLRTGDLNCLTSEARRRHLTLLINGMAMERVKKLFGNRPSVLRSVIQRARTKAEQLLLYMEKGGVHLSVYDRPPWESDK